MQNGNEIDAETAAGEQLRAELSANLKSQEKLIVSSGTLLGYRYDGSPIVVPDDTAAPEDHPRNYQPTARPGHRAPHVWLDDGSALMDHFGSNFTLLVAGKASDADVSTLQASAKAAGIPLSICHQENPAVEAAYEAKFTIIRPDLMVGWRANSVPDDPAQVLKTLTGQT